MAQIVINEISANYQYNIGANSYATVALPITACWGPGYFNPDTTQQGESEGERIDLELEKAVWQRFPATQTGLEQFVAAYRGPASPYRLSKDYSYQVAMTLLTSGYDVLVCRLCPGSFAQSKDGFKPISDKGVKGAGKTSIKLNVKAKYPGTFGNNLHIRLKKISRSKVTYWNLITYVVDSSGQMAAVENLTFVLSVANSNDSILYYREVESNFVSIDLEGETLIDDESKLEFYEEDKLYASTQLSGGTDYDPTWTVGKNAVTSAVARYLSIYPTTEDDAKQIIKNIPYTNALSGLNASGNETPQEGDIDKDDPTTAAILAYREWLFTAAVGSNLAGVSSSNSIHGVFDLLKDKLTYNPNRIISPGWDDQDYSFFGATWPDTIQLSPMHIKLMDVAYYSRCATSFLDIPRSLPRRKVYNESTVDEGYAQKLARYLPENAADDINSGLYTSHSALFAPWSSYTYAGTRRPYPASPSFIALMISRAMILNQAIQYEWALPTNRKHTLRIGKPDYIVPKHLLDEWQKLDGVGVNVITNVPDLGTTVWGNSTLFEVPPATYQALANLSTRLLVNAVEDIVYRCGIAITYQYNNAQAYNKFYAGVTPILDTMKNVGAIEDYYVTMAADINGLDQVNANTVIGKIYLTVNGVINDIYVDLIVLPPNVDLSTL